MTPQQRASGLFAFACTEQAPPIVQILIRHWEKNPHISEAEILLQAVRALSKENTKIIEALTRKIEIALTLPVVIEDGSAASEPEIEANRDPNRYDLAALNFYFEDEGPFGGE